HTGGEHDIVLSGYESSRERPAAPPPPAPYYVSPPRLIVRTNDKDIPSWSARGKAAPPRRVGVLRGSASERYLQGRFGDAVKLQSSETVTEMLDIVRDGRGDIADGTRQDAPAPAYYGQSGRYRGLEGGH